LIFGVKQVILDSYKVDRRKANRRCLVLMGKTCICWYGASHELEWWCYL